MTRHRKYTDTTVGLRRSQIRQLEELAIRQGSSKSDVIRQAVDKYIELSKLDDNVERDSLIESRLRKLENRIANLTVLSTRASAQTLYYITLPFSKGGFPAKPLNKEAFQAQWSKSRYFASQFLKNAQIDPLSEQKEESD